MHYILIIYVLYNTDYIDPVADKVDRKPKDDGYVIE